MVELSKGNFIGGAFVQDEAGRPFTSHDPMTDEVVFQAFESVPAVDAAVAAATAALPAWRRRSVGSRVEALRRLIEVLPRHVEGIADAITAEMGKTRSDSLIEAKSIGQKLIDTAALVDYELPKAAPGAPGEQRHHALGVVAIIGPFNYPVHLINTHLVPALVAGNTVVAKASELTPLTGQRYAALFEEAGLPAGVFNLVQGGPNVGKHLVEHPDVRGVVFTGSYGTARRIQQALLDQPWKKLALELGGKNVAVVLDDAALDHTVREILLGALLTTGQRCTATSRVVASPGIAPALRERLEQALACMTPGDPTDDDTLFGPLVSRTAADRFMARLDAAKAEGARPLVESRRVGVASVTPSLYLVTGSEALVTEELFGPNIAFEVAADEDDAIARAKGPYGLSAAIFTARESRLEQLYNEVPVGVVNWNRSTNGASGLLPFGGVGFSGNYQAGGSSSLRISSYPVALLGGPSTVRTPNPALDRALEVS